MTRSSSISNVGCTDPGSRRTVPCAIAAAVLLVAVLAAGCDKLAVRGHTDTGETTAVDSVVTIALDGSDDSAAVALDAHDARTPEPDVPTPPSVDVRDTGSGLNCFPSVEQEVTARPVQFAYANIVLPQSFEITQHERASGATFSDPDWNAFGWIASMPTTSIDVELLHSGALIDVAAAGDVLLPEYSATFELPSPWWAEERQSLPVPPSTGVRAQLRASYGPGTDNEVPAEKDPAALRDDILGAISDSAIPSTATGRACHDLAVHWLTRLRPEQGDVIMAGLVTCQADLERDQPLRFVFEDLLGATTTAPGSYLPDDFDCEEIVVDRPPPKADVLIVVDNSGSMFDEMSNVANAADEIVEQASDAGDVRIAVTTSDTYLLPNAHTSPERREFGPDGRLDHDTGLRQPGFVAVDDPDAASLVRELLLSDDACDRSAEIPAAQLGDNLCGSGDEMLLESGWTVLDRMARDPRPEYSVREEAALTVVWLGDEAPDVLKESGVPIPEDDPRFAEHVARAVDAYARHDAIGFAIVGDAGLENGGACRLQAPGIDLDEGVAGAEPGRSYRRVASQLGGASGSICNADLSSAVEAMFGGALGVSSQLELDGYPITPSIRVAVDGEVLPRSHTDGWEYNAHSNAIVFLGPRFPGHLSEVAVSYVMWRYSADATP